MKISSQNPSTPISNFMLWSDKESLDANVDQRPNKFIKFPHTKIVEITTSDTLLDAKAFNCRSKTRTELTRTKILETTPSELLLDANVRELRAKIVYRWGKY